MQSSSKKDPIPVKYRTPTNFCSQSSVQRYRRRWLMSGSCCLSIYNSSISDSYDTSRTWEKIIFEQKGTKIRNPYLLSSQVHWFNAGGPFFANSHSLSNSSTKYYTNTRLCSALLLLPRPEECLPYLQSYKIKGTRCCLVKMEEQVSVFYDLNLSFVS